MNQSQFSSSRSGERRQVIRRLLITAGVMGLTVAGILILFGAPPTFYDVTWWAGVVGLAALFGAWLAWRGQGDAGLALTIAALWLAVILPSIQTSGLSAAFAAVSLAAIYSLSSLMEARRLARSLNIASVMVALALIALDIFQPFKRDPLTGVYVVYAWIVAGGAVLAFGIIVARQTYGDIIPLLRRSIRTQFTVLITLLTLVSVVVLGVAIAIFAVNQERSSLQDNTLTQLEQTRTLKILLLRAYFNERQGDLRLNSASTQTRQALNALNEGFNAIGAATARALYLRKPELSTAGDSSAYTAAHSLNESYFTSLIDAYGYYDLFLINRDGQILYTYTKEDDFGTSLKNGPYADSILARLFNDTLNLPQGETSVSDFALYEPSGGAPAAFVAAPIYENGRPIGVLAFQVSLEQISAIMQERTGLGETGDTYVVGPDLLFRSESRFERGTLLKVKVDTEAARSALAGNSDSKLTKDYRDVPVVSSWEPFDLGGIHWAFIAEIDQSEALAPSAALVRELTGVSVAISLIVAFISAVLAAALARSFAAPIVNLTRTAETIAGGNFDVEIDTSREDELGTLASTFKQMTGRVRDLIASLDQRASQLATVADVGTATATILESQRLLQEVVDLTKERFGLYHSHIYLLDEDGQNLTLAAGAGEPGRIMAAEKRSIPLSREQSLVARAARERQGVTVNDVTQEADFLPNPLLPNTRSELAVPMIVGGSVIGVFDIQSDQVGRFTSADINIQTTLAAQLATSVQNVRSFERAKTQAEFEAQVTAISQRIQRATSIEDTLQTAARELGSALGAARVAVNIQSSRQDDLDTRN